MAYILIAILFFVFLKLSINTDRKIDFLPCHFTIQLDVYGILKKAGLDKKEIDKYKMALGANKAMLNEKHYYIEEFSVKVEDYSDSDINYYLFKTISFQLIRPCQQGYVMFNVVDKIFETKIQKRINLNFVRGLKLTDKSYAQLEFNGISVREIYITGGKGIEIGLFKRSSAFDDGISCWDDIFKKEGNYEILGVIPYSFIDFNSSTNKLIDKFNHELLNKYHFKKDSYYNEYWNSTEIWMENEYLRVQYGIIE